MNVLVPQCFYCKHFNVNVLPSGIFDFGGSPTCSAFPKHIPDRVFQNTADHREKYRGDNGIQYEPDYDRMALHRSGWLKKYKKFYEEWKETHKGEEVAKKGKNKK